eukprot:TRINITY_DN54764_c0_g1_i1.p1 TRINITY_DN54764_c0_g1~~TRINITY_DN54764_c0_g1_i1.p1  ORF type:complete len:664 (+),score=161.42 TRINITY_DN54764_c0_g1_i1:125-1993(+)
MAKSVSASAQKTVAGRTIQEVTDLSVDEQLYLYERSRRFKARAEPANSEADTPSAGSLCKVEDEDVDEKVEDRTSTVYLLFMEGSTRTRESLRNAGIFHDVKVNEFQAETSSFQKNETITDTMKMLSVYSTGRTVFVVRSPMEGVCSWLETVLPAHTSRFGIPKPSFVNAGDGRFTHPVNEFVDAFTLLETNRFDRSSVHLALIGDLAHGRTAHSKVDGLKVFEKVRVDLIAAGPFQYPVEYRNKMLERGFQVREFESLQDYIEQAADSLATCWYFYQPQFKRCGALTPGEQDALRASVSFRPEWCDKLPKNSRFFQTLPRNQKHPMVPVQLDSSGINGWDRLASNAYFVHTVLLSMLFGKVGPSAAAVAAGAGPAKALPASKALGSPQEWNFKPLLRTTSSTDATMVRPFGSGSAIELPDFMEPVQLAASGGGERMPARASGGGTQPIRDGLVIDHIALGFDGPAVWRTLRLVRALLGWSKYTSSEGVYMSKTAGLKGIMSLPNFDYGTLTLTQMKMLASIAPGCTVNAVKNSRVVVKYRLHIPERIYNLPSIRCKNELCVSNPGNKQRDVVAYFERCNYYETSALPDVKACEYLFVCKYCKWPHQYSDIWVEPSAIARNL